MKFLTENLRPAWLCGRKWELSTSSVKQMSVEPPVHTCSVNSFFGEPLPQYPWHVQMDPQPLKGLEPSMGWKEKHQLSFPLWEPVSGKCSHLPAATTAPGSLHLSGSFRWSPGSTLHHLHITALHQLFHTGKWLLLLLKFLPTSLRKKHYSIWRPTADKKKFCAFFFFPSCLKCVLYTKSILFMYQHESLHSCSDY